VGPALRFAATAASLVASLVGGPAALQPAGDPVDGAAAAARGVQVHRAGPGAVRVTWSAGSVTGVRAWQVKVVDTVGGAVTPHSLLALPGRRSLVVAGLPTGSTATASVGVFTGTRFVNVRPAPSGVRVAPGLCAGVGRACLSVDARHAVGRERHVAQGLLHGLDVTRAGVRRLHALTPRFWRITEGSSEETRLVRPYRASTTALLSDAWRAKASDPVTGRARSPWQDWIAYRKFVVHEARARLTQHDLPDYWEVQNEPNDPTYYSPQAPPTAARVLREFEVAYRAIRSVLPHAQVIGPSLGGYNLVGDEHRVGLTDFIDFATAHRLRFAAISWHELNAGNPRDAQPQLPQLVDRVRSVRTLLAASPVLHGAKIFINEYDSVWVNRQVGWDLGHITALEQAQVAQANRACFELCGGGADSLLDPNDGTTPRMTYWGRLAYARAVGHRLTTTTSDRDTTVMATLGGHRLSALLSRHADCTSRHVCPGIGGTTATGSGRLQLAIRLPRRAPGRVTVRITPMTSTIADVPDAPPAVTSHQRVGPGGMLRLPLSSVPNGAAVVVEVSWAKS